VTVSFRWYLAAMICLPLLSITVYLLWLWPTPGASQLAEFVPYLLSLMTGLPFFWIVSRGPARWWLCLVYLLAGFTILFFYAVGVLCGVRNVCL
jgi:hypothetical protein